MVTLVSGSPLSVPCRSIFFTMSIPSKTLPNTTCLPIYIYIVTKYNLCVTIKQVARECYDDVNSIALHTLS